MCPVSLCSGGIRQIGSLSKRECFVAKVDIELEHLGAVDVDRICVWCFCTERNVTSTG